MSENHLPSPRDRRNIPPMKILFLSLILLAMVFCVAPVFGEKAADEWLIEGGKSPDGKVEVWMTPRVPTDNAVVSRYFIAFRDAETKKVKASFVWNGDIARDYAPKETRAVWSPLGKFVALSIRCGRLSKTTEVYFVSAGLIEPVRLADFRQNILGRFKAVQCGPNDGDSPVRWLSDTDLLISAYGRAETPKEWFAYDFLVTIRLHGGVNDSRYGELIKVEDNPEKEE